MGPWSCSGILPNQRRGKMYGWSVSAYMRALSLVPLFSARLFVLFTAILLSAHAHVYCASTIFVVLVVCSAHEPSWVILVFFSFLIWRCIDILDGRSPIFILFRIHVFSYFFPPKNNKQRTLTLTHAILSSRLFLRKHAYLTSGDEE